MTDTASSHTANGSLSGQIRPRLSRKFSSASSFGDAGDDQEPLLTDDLSDDLDKLSMCLSEASSENPEAGKKSSLIGDIIQAQLALWTLIITLFYSYAWQQHRKKFLVSLFVVLPPVILFCCTMSSLLTAIVILGRVFSTPVRLQDILKFENVDDDNVNGGSGSFLRNRTVSGNSSNSGRSISCEELPRPVCRKHSNGGSTLSLCGGSVSLSCNGNGASSGSIGDMFGIARSDSISGSNPTTQTLHKLSHQFSHFSGGKIPD